MNSKKTYDLVLFLEENIYSTKMSMFNILQKIYHQQCKIPKNGF